MSTLIILDRDGVINSMVFNADHGLIDSPMIPEQVELLPGVIEALQILQQLQCRLAIASNQPAAAKGKTTPAHLQAVHQRVLSLLKAQGVLIESSQICWHRAEESCACRKPKPGLLIAAMAEVASMDEAANVITETWMVGDGITDVQAGHAAGVKTAFLGANKGEIHLAFETLSIQPDFWGRNLIDFARWFRKTKANDQNDGGEADGKD